jgi:hypothetical protein
VFSSKNWRCYEQRGEERNVSLLDDSRQTSSLRREFSKSMKIPRGLPADVECVAFVVHPAVTTRTLHRGEYTRLAGGVKEACSL